MKKLAVIFGGKSGEHQVSLVSAASVINAVDNTKYEVVEIGITEDGVWLTGKDCLKSFKEHNYGGLEVVNLSTDSNSFNLFDVAFPVLHGPFGEDGRKLMQDCAERNNLTMKIFGKEVGMGETAEVLAELVK